MQDKQNYPIMKKFMIVSNRLPLQLSLSDDQIKSEPSVGGLATGMITVKETYESLWVGWSGIDRTSLDVTKTLQVDLLLEEAGCIDVELTNEEIALYYEGFSNKTIWPLFHYFSQFVNFDENQWVAYRDVNQKFAEVILANLDGVDRVWIHDYHLLLLPGMVKAQRPDITIGFFLHIPFPSYELFRTLPWRMEIINGMLGADLLGFHTFDYERHFMSSVRRLHGYDIQINQISLPTRHVKVDNFPMGIDYDKYWNAARHSHSNPENPASEVRKELMRYKHDHPRSHFILSIDRLDYTKGLIHRLKAFEFFLENNHEYRETVSLVLLAVPSRIGVDQYQQMKSEVDEIVGRINGEYSTFQHTPVWYFYRSLPFQDLVDLYSVCDIALITPIRDGMNLVAKEFVASRIDGTGVLILSEMAGASKEMSEALLINPNDKAQMALAIKTALEMPVDEQKERIQIMQHRLSRYNIHKWAGDFLRSLENVRIYEETWQATKLNPSLRNQLMIDFLDVKRRALFLDYDGTLTGFHENPAQAYPDSELYGLFRQLTSIAGNHVIVISGRDRETLDKWFGHEEVTLVAEHGVWIKERGGEWQMSESLYDSWKVHIRPALEFYVDRTPGSFIEEKNYSLVWHYRKCDPELGAYRAIELKDELNSLVSNLELEILEGSKVIEVKNYGVNKGRAAAKLLMQLDVDKIMAIGDDWTDEFLFSQIPEHAITIKVGSAKTMAKYRLEGPREVRELLVSLVQYGDSKR